MRDPRTTPASVSKDFLRPVSPAARNTPVGDRKLSLAQEAQEGADDSCFGIRCKPQPYPARRNNLKPRGWSRPRRSDSRGNKLRIGLMGILGLWKPSNPPSHSHRVATVLPGKLNLCDPSAVELTGRPFLSARVRRVLRFEASVLQSKPHLTLDPMRGASPSANFLLALPLAVTPR